MRDMEVELEHLTRDARLRFREVGGFGGARVATQRDRYAEDFRESEGWGDFEKIVCCELTEDFVWTQETDRDRYGKTKSATKKYTAGTMLLVGGFTRVEGAMEAGVTKAPARVHSGPWAFALRLAWSENSRHGLRRSHNEIELVLESIHCDQQHANDGSRAIAKLAGCSRVTVDRWRKKQREQRRSMNEAETTAKGAEAESTAADPEPQVRTKAASPETTARSTPDATPSISLRRDAYGRPLPVNLVPLWEHVGLASKVIREIRTAVVALVDAKHGPDGRDTCLAPALARVDVKQVQAAVFAAADLIDNRLPFIVCPSCDGGGCFHCSSGALSRVQADALQGGDERKARSFSSGAGAGK